ncbi:MAG: TonB-dependent receptor plug domain-containing protein [Brevundimonas sp.]
MKASLWMSAALTPLLFGLAQPAAAQDADDQPTQVSEIIITGQPVFRNRTEDVAPTLSYDLEYFQRFEPLTVGDALKRVPSVAFLSDVLESDGVRLRGLDPGYTQILINGERVPGAGVDRSFFVDRIPAELIERVEVVRSSSANRSGDALAGAINIVLRDAYTLDGGYVRAGAMRFDDGEFRYTGGLTFGGEVGPGRLLFGANVQDRYNPKEKFSIRYDEPGGSIDNVEVQTDVRDGTDYALNAAYEVPFAGGELAVTGLFVRTDRTETENSIEYADGIIADAELETINDNVNDIETDNWSLGARLEREWAYGETTLRIGYAAITDNQFEFEDETAFDPFPTVDEFESAQLDTEIEDTEVSASFAHEIDLSDALELEFGVQYVDKQRDTLILERESDTPGVYPDPFEAIAGGDNAIEETRIDPYVMLEGEGGRLSWEVGLRYETTDVTIVDETADPADRVSETDYAELLPSASLRFALNETDRLIFSAARTVRRPNFNFLSPALLEEEVGDSDFIGNPDLEPETSVGFDIGFERRLGRRGVVGINAFYRDVTDLIENVVVTDASGAPLEGSEGPGTFVYSVDNVGDGEVYGVEFDLSTPLDVVGLENTGVYLNYSWLDSAVEDFLGDRRFNSQSDYIVSAGFTHDIPTWGAAFGASYRKQGDAFQRVLAEEVTTSYGEDLEVFIEKTFGQNVVVRLTGSNLLNASKDEIFDKFDNLEDQIDRDYDEYELETEEAGPVWQLIARVAF